MCLYIWTYVYMHIHAYTYIHKNTFLPVPVAKEGTITWSLPSRSPCSGEGERWVYLFPIAAVISCCKFNGLKQHTFIMLQFWGSKFNVSLSELKSRYRQGCVLSGGFRRTFVSLSFLVFGNYIPWLMFPSSVCKASSITPSNFSLTLLPPS